jgi:hypothetical protein
VKPIKVVTWACDRPISGSEGYGFESPRRKVKRWLSCGNIDQPPLVVCPLWTQSVPKVIRCFGRARTGRRRFVLHRVDQSGSWMVREVSSLPGAARRRHLTAIGFVVW